MRRGSHRKRGKVLGKGRNPFRWFARRFEKRNGFPSWINEAQEHQRRLERLWLGRW